MFALTRNPLARRVLRPAAALVDRRIERRTGPLRPEIDTLRREVAALREGQNAFGLLFDGTARSGPRTPTTAQLDTLVGQVSRVTGAPRDAARRNVVIAYRNVIALEMLAVGRLAGSTQNICGKLATVPLLAPRAYRDVLEIGTLYGLFSASLMRMLHRAGVEPRMTIVDPLAGSQLQPGTREAADPTGTPVREDVVRANLAFGGAPGAEARVVRGFSGDDDVRARVSDREYGVIVVDGDHSAEGVRADLEWAEKIAAPGGIVVVDDYGDDRWSGVKSAADAHLARPGSRFTLLGAASTSAFLRARD
ncbi:class I SAM-dependent methyltransferase [Streptomyces sp. NRRL F-5126]|uniref:class I SAM-dependent methyltransferase n=1 Tax=Streptomyces sp. NRRL F-5126 TaxID=1463857 RepID=UPI0004C6795A|nr:class I SAM-dependent methyltransferase [Streptomyces sp. NRRL F-5126]